MAVAHAAQEVLSDMAHASRHADAAAASVANPERLKFNLHHVQNHVGGALTQQNSSISNLIQLDPRAGDELAKLRDTAGPAPSRTAATGWQYAPPGPARGRTPAHLAESVLFHLTHARAHVIAAQAAPDPDNLAFEMGHLRKHVQESLDHQQKFIGAIREIFQPVRAELDALGKLADLGSTAKVPERSMPADGRLLLAEMTACGPLSDEEMDEQLSDGSAADRAFAEQRARYLADSVNGDLAL